MRKNEHKSYLTRFEFELSVDIIEKLEIPMQLVLNLQKHEKIEDVTLLFIKAPLSPLLLDWIDKHLRITDIVYRLNHKEKAVVAICQNTDAEGGLQLSKRILEKLNRALEGEHYYIVELFVPKHNSYKGKEVLYRLVEILTDIKLKESKNKEIYYYSLH